MNNMRIVFATNNINKLSEIRKLASNSIDILSLKDIKCFEELPETTNTLEGNAREKSVYVFKHYGENCFSDDTGLEIDVLDGRPGVYSARYAGIDCNSEDNIQKILKEMQGEKNRRAIFRTVISLILDGQEFQFEGEINGEIVLEKTGCQGFGYDPIFVPDGFRKSFAEMSMEQKNRISHRSKAVKKLITFLQDKIK